MTKKISIGGGIFLAIALLISSFAVSAHATANWNTSGNYQINVNYLGTNYPETLVLTQSGSNITGGSLNSIPVSSGSAFTVTNGTVNGDTINFSANQDNGTIVTNFTGTIASNGTLSGTWSDVAPGTRTGTWTSTSGVAMATSATLTAEDFGVVNYDTGLGQLKGYTAGFGLTNGTLAGAQSVVVKLYNGSTLLQTNTAIMPKFNADITGTQFSSPFDVSGNFQYANDGYWTNVRASQYGQSTPATRVVATVTLHNGQIVTAENTNLTGDATTVYPPVVTNYLLHVTKAGTGTGTVTSSPAGINCGVDCSESYANNTSVTLTAVAASGSTFSGWSGACSGTSTCMTTMSAAKNVTATFTLNSTNNGNGKDECKDGGWRNFHNPSYKNQGQCVSSHNHQNKNSDKNHEDNDKKGQHNDEGDND